MWGREGSVRATIMRLSRTAEALRVLVLVLVLVPVLVPARVPARVPACADAVLMLCYLD